MSNEIVYITQEGPFWDWQVAVDLFLGGAGVGALLFAILLNEVFDSKYRRICSTAAWISPFLVGAGLLLIMFEMGRPMHLFITYLNFNPTSPLWWGGIFQPLVIVGGFVYANMWRNPDKNRGARRTLGRVLIPLTIIVGAYHGMLMAVMVSHPLWNTGPTVIAALLGFAASGIATVMLVHLLRMKLGGRLQDEEHVAAFLDDMRIVRNTLGVLLVLKLGTFYLWWLSLRLGSLQDQQALAIANKSHGTMFWGLGVGLGLILPILLGLYSMYRGEAQHRKLQVNVIAWSSAMIVIGTLFFRLALLLAGQEPQPVNLIL